MLNLEEIREMASIDPDGAYYISLYLNIDPHTNPRGEYLINARNMLKQTGDGLPKEVFKKVREDLRALEDYFVVLTPREHKKAIVLISSSLQGFWKEYRLGVPVKSGIFVDRTPYLKPIFDLLDRHRRYAALLVAKDRARIFVIHLGEIEEYAEVRSEGVPGRQAEGGWFALEQDRFERHVDYHTGVHLEDVARHLQSFMEKQKTDLLFVGGPEESLAMGIEWLPEGLRSKIGGTFSAGMYEPSDQLLSRLEPLLLGHEGKKEEGLVDELITRAFKNKQAVLGVDDVLAMLQEGRVMTLVVDSEYSQRGYICTNCRALFSSRPEQCRYCQGRPEEVDHMADFIMQKTVEQGGDVDVVPGNDKLKNAGNIGALLRY
jgi:peptide chain release factor subunit 1